MSGHDDDLDTWRLGDRASAPPPDDRTVSLGKATGLTQSWAAVPLAGEDRPPEPDPAAAVLETVRADDPGTDTPTQEWHLADATEPSLAAADFSRVSATTPLPAPAPMSRTTPPTTGATTPQPGPGTGAPAGADDGVAPGLLRFGPGVPDPAAAQAAAVWHGATGAGSAPPRRRRRAARVLVALVLLAALAFLLWQRFGPALSVSSVAVTTSDGSVACGATRVVTGTVRTSGGAGTLRYHWVRNDGTDSGPLRQKVAAGHHTVRLPLRWSFRGHGVYRARATLSVDAPGTRTASVSFTYSCPR